MLPFLFDETPDEDAAEEAHDGDDVGVEALGTRDVVVDGQDDEHDEAQVDDVLPSWPYLVAARVPWQICEG